MTPTIADTGYIAVTAAEGGIGYWSLITLGYNPDRWFESPDGEPSNDLPDDFVFYTIREDDEAANGEPAQEWNITPALIRRGFALAMHPDANIAGWAFRDQIDPSDPDSISCMDANAADIVIQMGCYGRVIYG
jgi:hypothetical protein